MMPSIEPDPAAAAAVAAAAGAAAAAAKSGGNQETGEHTAGDSDHQRLEA